MAERFEIVEKAIIRMLEDKKYAALRDILAIMNPVDVAEVFSELEEGLYMLVQTERIDGFYPIYPVLLTIPLEENWDVLVHKAPVPVVTEIPKTGQSPIPFLGVLGMVLSATGLLLCRKKIRD